MAIRGVSLTITYTAWNTSTNAPQTGDVSNHTIKVCKDGVEATATNSPSEVDSTNFKGEYKLVLTSTEMTCDFITIGGVSSTANVVIVPVKIATEHGVLPTVQQGNAGAVLTSGTGTAQLNVSSGKAPATLAATDVTGNVAADLQTIKTQIVTCAAGVTVLPNVGTSTHALVVDASGFVTVATNNDKTGYSLSVAPPTAAAIATAVWTDTTSSDFTTSGSPGSILVGANGIETGVSLKQAVQRIGATTAGILSGSETNTEVFLGLDGVSTRVTITTDTSGNRTAIVYA